MPPFDLGSEGGIPSDAPAERDPGWPRRATQPIPGAEGLHPSLGPMDPAGLSWSLVFPARDGQPGWIWCHYDLVHAQARQAIHTDHALPEFAAAILLGSDESPRVVSDGSVVAGVVPAYARTGDATEHTLTAWHFAMTPTHVVTARRVATRSLVELWEAARQGRVPAGPAGLVHRGVAAFAREVRLRLAVLANGLDPIEDLLIEPDTTVHLAELAARLGATRREATQLKRVLVPLARALGADDLEDLPAWAIPPDHDPGLRLLHAALDDIAALYDRARSLQDELNTRLAEETNRRLYVVSLVTTIVVPATFVTGFFGMNTGALPWSGEDPYGTIYAGLVCLAAVLVTLVLLRWKRLL